MGRHWRGHVTRAANQRAATVGGDGGGGGGRGGGGGGTGTLTLSLTLLHSLLA